MLYKKKSQNEIDAIKKEYSDRRKFGKTAEYKQFIDDLHADNNLLLDTLLRVKNKYKGTVYRGTWGIKGLPPRGITTFKTFTSTAKKPEVTEKFIWGNGGLSGVRKVIGNNVLMKIKLNGINGVDLTAPGVEVIRHIVGGGANGQDEMKKYIMSVQPDESEVLCPPGTKVRVKQVIKNVNLTKYAKKANVEILNNRKDRRLAENVNTKIGNLVIAEEVK